MILKNQGNNNHSRGNGKKRNSSGPSKNRQNHNNGNKKSNRGTGRGTKSHQPHLWASSTSSSTTLTSHLSMVSRRNQDGSGKNTGSTNGAGRPNGKSKRVSNYQKNGRNRDDSQKRINKRYHKNKSNSVRKSQPFTEVQTTSNASTQGSEITHSGALKSKTNTFGIDPFELFCAYHLGISSQNQYRPSNINEVANRFKIDVGTARQILKEYGMDSASLLDRDFDMALAQLDIQVAPEGINRTELGRSIFEDFLKAPIRKRDWKKILEDDKRENAKTFNKQ